MSAVAQFGAVTAMRPAFTVAPMRRKVVKNYTTFDRELRKTVSTPKEKEVDGFYVKCYRGHEMFIETVEELRRLGFTGAVPLIGKTNDSDEENVVGVLPSTLNLEKDVS